MATKDTMVAYGEHDVMEKLQMGAVEKLILSESLDDDKIEQFEEIAKQLGTEVLIASVDTREGEQLREIGKVIAILRYAI
jgi:stalled ribosome rescue protein Dom34